MGTLALSPERQSARMSKLHMTAYTIRYDTIEEFNVDSKAEYSALSSLTRCGTGCFIAVSYGNIGCQRVKADTHYCSNGPFVRSVLMARSNG